MKIAFAKPDLPASGVVVAFVLDDNVLSPSAQALDDATGGALARAMEASRFKGKMDQRLTLLAPHGTKLDRIELLGLGKADALNVKTAQNLGGNLSAGLGRIGASKVVVMVDALEGAPLSPAEMATEMGFGALLRSYSFDKYRTKLKDEDKPSLKTLSFHCDGNTKAKKALVPLEKIAEGVFFTRDLCSEPANILYPEEVCKRAKELTELGVKVEVLGEKEMTKLGMGALLGVGQGSVRESKLLVLQWAGNEAAAPKGKKAKDVSDAIAFVGKGVCFDTGGISIKPAGGMEDMKWDMGGAGVVCGLMKALAGRKAKVNVVGVAGLVENMPDGNAQRPGDIVTSMSGQTIEVLNTDAEGRLVLADALWYTKERFKPKFMVDLATLTGAIIISLADQYAGLFSNDDDLSAKLQAAGEAVGEGLWRMPMSDAFDKMINSDAADMKNISGGRGGGSTTAAQFLKRFVGETPWAHLDIAGVTWSKKDSAVVPKGATGFGVRLLDKLVADNYEG